jgi:Ca-activated chloride channel family protein
MRVYQQGAHLLATGQAALAAERFHDPLWQAVARYRAGEYSEAASDFSKNKTADGDYNRGNALAKSGDYSAAIAAYDEALKKDPQHADAKFNRDLLKKLKHQKKPNSSSSNKNQSPKSQSSPKQDEKSANKNEQKDKTDPPKPSQAEKTSNDEQREARSQWLSQVPDDPGGLLRQKFLRDHERLQAEG